MPFVAAVYGLALAVLALFGAHLLWLTALSLRPRPEAPRPAPGAPPAPAPAQWPPVLVQVPVYAEPPALVERVLGALAALDYPRERLAVQLLDDSPAGTTREAAAAAARWRARGLPVEHVVRASRRGFKAGALAEGLHAAPHAPFCALFDADFVPPPDFLRRALPLLLADPGLAFVQAPWAHPGAQASALTRAQAALLDLHFGVEQAGREAGGLLVGFNGTAGVWRVAAIREAGGWQGDTLAEDLDLSLRAGLAGWRGRLVPGLSVPADLPGCAADWRAQQFRWSKGAAEVGRKLGRRLAGSALPRRVRASALVHTQQAMAWPALLAVVLLHPLVAGALALGARLGGGEAFFGIGAVALAGPVAAHLAAQHGPRAAPGASLGHTLRALPLALVLPLGLVLTGTRAWAEGVLGRRSAFVRTPKGGLPRPGRAPWRLPEAALAAYAAGGGVWLASLGAWTPALVQAVFALALAAGAGGWPRPAAAPGGAEADATHGAGEGIRKAPQASQRGPRPPRPAPAC